jgi:hypothetical protein
VNTLKIQSRYTRSDPKAQTPRLAGVQDIDLNRLATFWRPMIDLTDSELAPMRLRFTQPVAEWIADPSVERWSWFAMMGIPGLRHQVIRHAGLDRYDSREPHDLAPELRTPAWERLLDSIERFEDLEPRIRALVVFQLAQLSYGEFVLKICPLPAPTGDPDHDRFAYEVARVYLRYPGRGPETFRLFAHLAETAEDPLLALLACFQGISHAIRITSDLPLADDFAERGRRVLAERDYPDTWHGTLVRSRFHRSLALLGMTARDLDRMRSELEIALALDAELEVDPADEIDASVALENKRILVEAQIRAASRDDVYRERVDIAELCERLMGIDPYCVEARIVVGEGYAALDDYATAGFWYSRAGELGTAAGAVGWFRAAQCYDFIGDRWGATNAMARCLELDNTAVEAQTHLAASSTRPLAAAV